MEQVQNTACVQICDEEYRIASHLDAEVTRRVAACVDVQMRAVEARVGSLNRGKVAVLAAMELAAELLQLREEREMLLEQAHGQIRRLNALVEQRSSLLPMTSEWMEQRAAQARY